MVVIAFSGIGNTGKSTIIKKIKKKYENDMSVIVLWENARDAIKEVGMEDRAKLQQTIFDLEETRAERLKEHAHEYDLVLVDRPRTDQLAYLQYNIVNWYITEPVAIKTIDYKGYDHIITFFAPIKKSRNFVDYYKGYEQITSFIYPLYAAFPNFPKCQYKSFRNGMDSEREIMMHIEKIIKKMGENGQ